MVLLDGREVFLLQKMQKLNTGEHCSVSSSERALNRQKLLVERKYTHTINELESLTYVVASVFSGDTIVWVLELVGGTARKRVYNIFR